MNLTLYVPNKTDLWFKKEIKEDPKTMDYNTGYDVSFSGYDYNKGTIITDIEDLENNWFCNWINNWPTNFYAYIVCNKTFVGEIYAKWQEEHKAYEIGIVIKAEYRGKGYATPAIGLLCDTLKQLGAKKLFHELPTSRIGAITADVHNGFVIEKENIDGMKKFGEIEKLTYLTKVL